MQRSSSVKGGGWTTNPVTASSPLHCHLCLVTAALQSCNNGGSETEVSKFPASRVCKECGSEQENDGNDVHNSTPTIRSPYWQTATACTIYFFQFFYIEMYYTFFLRKKCITIWSLEQNDILSFPEAEIFTWVNQMHSLNVLIRV